MAIAITTTPQDITGDFDLSVIGGGTGVLGILKSLGSATTEWAVAESIMLPQEQQYFVKNTGTNSFKLDRTVAGVTVKFSQ